MTVTETEASAVPGAAVTIRSQASAIPAKLAYARELANSGLLPAAYRKNPANVLWAMEYGEMLGLSPMAAMTGVHVIDGKPTASAGLISGLVRQAGHRLRVWGDDKSATCEITRSDDPRHVFRVTWTLRKEPGDNPSAEVAGLLSKNVWKQYPAAMLKSRVITQCARDSCEEVLFGLHYTPEELGADVDEDGVVLPCDADAAPEPAAATPDDDPWYVRAAPDGNGDHPDSGQQRWVKGALLEADNFRSEPAGQRLWRDASAAVLDGRATPGEADHVKNTITKRIAERRKKTATGILKPLAEDDPWRETILELASGSDDDARARLGEVQQLVGAGTLDDDRGKLLGRAIVALRPKAALAGETDG